MEAFWRGRRVLVTGHTGFKGAWLTLWLERLGAQVTGIALAPPEPGAFVAMGPWPELHHHEVDIRDPEAVAAVVGEARPQVVFHLAAQPLVRAAYSAPGETYDTNVMGTIHLLEAVRLSESRPAVLVVTTDKVYANAGEGNRFVEDDPLGGGDPYSNSKACVELVVRSWNDTVDIFPVATARAGNVIGGGDWSVDRIVPDVVRAVADEVPVVLRSPDGIRPWQFVLEPLSGYLAQAQRLAEAPDACPRALNFGPDASSETRVADLVERLHALLGSGHWTQDTGANPHEAATLRLDNRRAAETLHWVPRLSLDEALAWTADWYRAELNGHGDLRALACEQIDTYEKLLTSAL